MKNIFQLLAALVLTLCFMTSVSAQVTSISDLREAQEKKDAQLAELGGGPAPVEENVAPPVEDNKPAGQGNRGNILQTGWWGPGGYFSPIKLAVFILIFLFWTGTASWCNSDQERLKKENREIFNFVYLFLFLGLGGAVFFVPIFWVSFPVIFLLWYVPAIVYIVKRNAALPPHMKVLTGEHLFYLYAVAMNKIGVKITVKQRMSYEIGPPIEMEALGRNIDPKILQGRTILARNSPGYNDFRQAIYDAITYNATSLMFDFTPERTAVRHQVDGVWLDLAPIPRVVDKNKGKDPMEEMLEAAKILVGANPADRRSRQGGSFVAAIGSGKRKVRYESDFLSQGTKTGEAVMVQFTRSKVPFKDMKQLGVRDELQPKIIANLNAKQGIFAIAAPPANGLRSSMDVFSRLCDRFTRDVVNVEDAAAASEEIENVILARYDSSKGETPMKVLPDVLFKEPHCLIVRDMTNPEVMKLCCDEVDQHRLFITMIRAKDGVEAILRYLALKAPPQPFISKLNAVLSQRLIRKLCPDCKEPYQPAPQLLQQLGVRPDQVKELYRTRTPLSESEERKRGVCETCNGIGYRGRTALFELIEISDSFRELVLSNPNPTLLRQQLLKERQGSFAQEGVYLLMKGETTVEEFSRVMKS